MRQIDNMTPQEIEMLHLKGMLSHPTAQKPPASEGRQSSDAYDEEKLKAHADKLAEMVRTLRQSIRHAHNCKAPQAFPCSCDADTLWNESAEALAAYESEAQP